MSGILVGFAPGSTMARNATQAAMGLVQRCGIDEQGFDFLSLCTAGFQRRTVKVAGFTFLREWARILD
jgi:hypothetical protein